MRLSVIIPTYKRPFDLGRALESLNLQNTSIEELLVIIGPGDEEGKAICKIWKTKISNLYVLNALKPSTIHALNLGISAANGDVICLLDDDVWLPNDWAYKIKIAYKNNMLLGAYGGRDKLHLNLPEYDHPSLAKVVGTFQWNGILKGNHHCGSVHSPVKVDVLKGVNLSFRRSALKPLQIEQRLENKGAEICYEIDICSRIQLAGYDIIYDNNNFVLHYASPRSGNDKRNDVFAATALQNVYNNALVVAKYRPFSEVFFYIIRSFFLGSKASPGIIHSLFLLKQYKLKAISLPFINIAVTVRAMKEGLLLRRYLYLKKNGKF